jgi:hypothetical protein
MNLRPSFYPTLLAALLAAIPAWAGPWHALHAGGKADSPASLSVERETDQGLILKAHFPGFRLGERRHPLAGDYVAPEMAGCGISEAIGAPELPVLRRLIVVPDGVMPRLAVSGMPLTVNLGKGSAQAFFPRQRPRSKDPRSPKLLPFDFDVAAYADDGFSPALPGRLTEAGIAGGQRLMLVEVFPVAVNPLTQGVRLFPDLRLTVSFDGAPAAVKGTAPAAAAKTTRRLLIIAPDAWTGSLAALVSHREARGWTVDVLGTVAAGATTPAIRTSIRNRYLEAATRPDALLLIGDVAQIPCFTGTQEDNPDTDLYYGCMDGSGDWQPEFPVGRLSVTSAASLEDVIAKIITTETTASGAWMTRAAFMASEDNHAITETTHNAVIAALLEPNGYQCDKLYSLRGATPAQVRAAFNEGRILGVYSGHGDTTYWADGPVFYKGDVQALTNQGRYPVIFSFACLTGQYSLNECFAETWLRQPDKAACGVLASSVTSYWDEDDIFERRLFDTIFTEGKRVYGDALLRAKFRLIEMYGQTATVRRYFEQYNFFGDPSAPLKEPTLSLVTGSPLPTGYLGAFYSETLRAAGGSEPYAWTLLSLLPEGLDLAPGTGVLSGTPLETADNLSVLVRLTDADLAVVTGQFRLTVAAGALHVAGGTNAGPFQAGAPFSSALAAQGGVPPYTWAFEQNGYYEKHPGQGAWIQGGKAMNWQADERSWKLKLPWAFRFFDQSHTSVWINSNGYLDFGSKASQWDNSTNELARHPRIAPLWDDLRTTNVFVHMTSKKVVIRWAGTTFSAGYPIAFEAILKKNGSILFVYRAMGGKLSPTAGLSGGLGTPLSLSQFNGVQSLSAGDCETFLWRPPLSAGVTLSPAGLLSGTVAAPMTRTVSVRVTDSATPARTATADLTLTVE